MTEDAPAQQRPLLSVVRGAPTPEQLAAVIAVVTARSTGGDSAGDDAPAPSLWSQPQLRAPLAAGPAAWRASGLPH